MEVIVLCISDDDERADNVDECCVSMSVARPQWFRASKFCSRVMNCTYAMEMPCCPCICAGISGGGRLAWPVVRCLWEASRRIPQRSSCARHRQRCRWPVPIHVSLLYIRIASIDLASGALELVRVSVCAHGWPGVMAEENVRMVEHTLGEAIWPDDISIRFAIHEEAHVPLGELLRRP